MGGPAQSIPNLFMVAVECVCVSKLLACGRLFSPVGSDGYEYLCDRCA